MKEYFLPAGWPSDGYNVFPLVLEDDPLVVFHSTLASNYENILKYGFKTGEKLGTEGCLSSVSFSKKSKMAVTHILTHLLSDNCGGFKDCCVFAVRYHSLNQPGITVQGEVVYDYLLCPRNEIKNRCTSYKPPKIIGYCNLPRDKCEVAAGCQST